MSTDGLNNSHKSVGSVRVAHPLFQAEGEGSTPVSTLQVSDLIYERCPRSYAIRLNQEWHSRLPLMGTAGVQYAFHARHGDISYAIAIWTPPVARLLPQHYLELRRMASSPEFPKNAASNFLGWMARYFKKTCPQRERLISYQDTDVHTGTIYKASGWKQAYRSREGDTWKGECRERKNLNGDETIASVKIRWEKVL